MMKSEVTGLHLDKLFPLIPQRLIYRFSNTDYIVYKYVLLKFSIMLSVNRKRVPQHET